MADAIPAGWYPDPSVPGTQRYWDGGAWTDHTAPRSMPPPTTGRPPLATFGQRVGAAIVDALVVAVPMTVIVLVLVGLLALVARTMLSGLDGGGSGAGGGLLVGGVAVVALALVALVVVPLLYAIGFEGSPRGQTIGKWALRIRVVDGRTAGRLAPRRAAIRVLARSFASGALFGLGYLWMLWDDQRRTWHDLAADSRVVVVDDPRPPLGELVRSWSLRG